MFPSTHASEQDVICLYEGKHEKPPPGHALPLACVSNSIGGESNTWYRPPAAATVRSSAQETRQVEPDEEGLTGIDSLISPGWF